MALRSRQPAKSQQAKEPETLEPEPPFLDTVPNSREQFERAVGRAITNWQEVDEALCELFVVLSRCRTDGIARAIYWTLHDFSDKLTITRNVARLVFDESSFLIFNRLRNRLIKASEVRNAIAHYHVIFHGTTAGRGRIQFRRDGDDAIALEKIEGEQTFEIRLQPNYLDPNAHFRPPRGDGKPEWLNTTMVRNASSRFIKLSRELFLMKETIISLSRLRGLR